MDDRFIFHRPEDSKGFDTEALDSELTSRAAKQSPANDHYWRAPVMSDPVFVGICTVIAFVVAILMLTGVIEL